jgi:DNA-binding CsgD family transcriptional regulator
MDFGKEVEKPSRAYGEDDRTKSQTQIDDEARQVFEMVLAGMRTDQIAAALGISIGGVSRRRERGAKLAVVPKVEQYREESAARLDGFMAALIRDNPKATPRVIEAAMALETRRAKLFGMDMPTQVDVTLTQVDGGIDAEVARLADELGMTVEQLEQEPAE